MTDGPDRWHDNSPHCGLASSRMISHRSEQHLGRETWVPTLTPPWCVTFLPHLIPPLSSLSPVIPLVRVWLSHQADAIVCNAAWSAWPARQLKAMPQTAQRWAKIPSLGVADQAVLGLSLSGSEAACDRQPQRHQLHAPFSLPLQVQLVLCYRQQGRTLTAATSPSRLTSLPPAGQFQTHFVPAKRLSRALSTKRPRVRRPLNRTADFTLQRLSLLFVFFCILNER